MASNAGCEFGRRVADDFENVGRRRLLLQRFGQIVGALAQFVEQTGILDGDDGLRREIRYQLDLLIAERLRLLAENAEGTD